MYFQTKNKADCCGCGLCSQICPKNAITMTDDECGFRYPVVEEDICVHCGLCEKVCIFREKIRGDGERTRFYAVRSKDDEVVLRSSSGGMLTVMAEEIFSREGVLYGVAYGENFRVEHQRARNLEEAKGFRGSKYVQSDAFRLFADVKQDLEQGRDVLVTGTPCQITALNAYLAHAGVDQSHLYTCDNICHGVSSPMVFADYLECMKRYIPKGDAIRYVNMRHKAQRSGQTSLHIESGSGYVSEADRFSYYRLFFNRIANRPACFACRFTSYARPGDLSAADFWNSRDGEISYDASLGLNEVLVNTPKGERFFEAIRERAYCQEVSREKAWQPHLEYPTQMPDNYEAFWKEYLDAEDREVVMRKYLKVSPLFKLINFMIPILRKTGLYAVGGKLYKAVFVKKAKGAK